MENVDGTTQVEVEQDGRKGVDKYYTLLKPYSDEKWNFY